MSFPRSSGILLHLTSLPGRFGIGDFGNEAYTFIDFLADTGQRLWQILPLGPADSYNSPYKSSSVFAGNPLLISLEKLAEQGLLQSSDLENYPELPRYTVDYNAVIKYKMPLIKKSFTVFDRKDDMINLRSFADFCSQNSSWLDTYALFMALKEVNEYTPWNYWSEEIKKRTRKTVEYWTKELNHEIRFQKYIQFQFYIQWHGITEYCHERGIKIIGDLPIFVALDSAEVWSHPELFKLDNNGAPTVVAGVPPDYFSQTGQLWGNPLYNWDIVKSNNYRWWTERIKFACNQLDIIRLDHFRGFEKNWEIPAGESTAINGRWVPGPGAELFELIEKELGILPFIAEDLGVITPEVIALRDKFEFPGMKVLQFAFGNDPLADEYKPHNYVPNCCVYTGTHDNNTTIGWFKENEDETTTRTKQEREEERKRALDYLGTDGSEINWDFIRAALKSPANTALIPLQDVLGSGSEARMNRPGILKGNWRWRFTFNMLTDEIKLKLKELTHFYGR